MVAGLIAFASNAYATVEHFELVVSNQSDVAKHHVIVPVEIPEAMQQHFISVSRNGQSLPSILSPDRKKLLVQLDMESNEEALLTLSFDAKPFPEHFLIPSTSPGTKHICVNYQRLLVISTQNNNEINFKNREGQILETFQLNKGQMHVFQSSSPQLLIIESQYPVFVYLSSLGDDQVRADMRYEAGDSDTTTLFGSELYFYVNRHLWVSSYEETRVSLYDASNFLVWEKNLQANEGIFVSDLSPGAYSINSTAPVTAQFGYLDDENYSFVLGKRDQINGFSFGHLLITSLHPDTTIDLTYFNPRRQQKEIRLENPGDHRWVPIIELFLPYEPEYAFFTLNFDKPVLVNTFSSGTNFGGSFVPGRRGLFVDDYFTYITPKLSREFSKEQKNMMEILGLHNETFISILNSMHQEVELPQYTNFNFLTYESLSLTKIEGTRPFLLSQVHNYTQKGLFLWVPPLEDRTINATIGRPVQFLSNNNEGAGWSNWNIDSFRFSEFFANVTQPQYIFFTIFFASLLLLLLLLLLIFIIGKKTSSNLVDEENEKPMEKIAPEESELVQLMQTMEKKLNQSQSLDTEKPRLNENIPEEPAEPEKPTLGPSDIKEAPEKPIFQEKPSEDATAYPRLNVSYEDWIARFKEKKQEQAQRDQDLSNTSSHEPEPIDKKDTPPSPIEKKSSEKEIDLPFLDVDHTKSIGDEEIINSNMSKLSSFFDKKLVLDPGSANRLYHEGLLGNFNQAHMTKSSAKRLQPNVAKLLLQVELNAQDLSKAELFKERLETLEEAGKAIVLCKKKRIGLYITSYRLPNFIQRIQILHISELLKEI